MLTLACCGVPCVSRVTDGVTGAVQAVFLHCIEQHPGQGGETMLADGFEAARQLRAARPEALIITWLTRR